MIFKNPSPRALDVQELFPLPNFCTWSLGGSSDCAQMGLGGGRRFGDDKNGTIKIAGPAEAACFQILICNVNFPKRLLLELHKNIHAIYQFHLSSHFLTIIFYLNVPHQMVPAPEKSNAPFFVVFAAPRGMVPAPNNSGTT